MRRRGRTGLLAWWLALAGAVLVLHASGGALPAPPLADPSGWPAWVVGRDPVVVAFGLARVLALAAAWYGLVVTIAGVALRLVDARTLSALVDRLTVVPLRRMVAATLTVGMSVGPLGTAAGAFTRGAVDTGPAPASTPTTTVVGPIVDAPGRPPGTVTMHRVDATEATSPASPPSPAAPDPRPETPAPPDAGDARATTRTVRIGECFWSIAEAELRTARGRPPTTAEIVAYWKRLIEVNRGELADPDNADLIFPGQVFALPAP